MNGQAAVAVPRLVAGPSRVSFDLATIAVLFKRDLKRLLRQRSRLIGALGQPLIFWLVIGGGFSGSVRLTGAPIGYLEYFYPGVVAMVVLFSSIFGAMSLIEDRREGFLQAVLAGPGSRASLAVGKILGGATVAWLQGMAFVGLAPLAGFPFAHVQYLSLALILALAAIGLTGLGFALAWKIESTQGYHAVVSLLLIPLWVVSGAMFPAHDGPLFIVMRANPVAYLVDGVRQAFYGGVTPANLGLGAPWGLDLGVSAIFALVAVAVAAVACQRR